MNSDPERLHDAQQAVHIRAPEYAKLAAPELAARQALADELEQGLPCRADRETMLGALRAVWALSERWAQGISDVGPAAAAEVRDAVRAAL